MTSFEADPLTAPDIARALAPYGSLAHLAEPMLRAWPFETFSHDGLVLSLILGDARATLPSWTGQADAWFLDGFAPAQNPEMWQPDLLAEVARHTRAGGQFATYTAAGHIRRTLSDAGFDVERRPGFGRKRHMSVGRLK